jgi:WD40 repeat protein
MQGGKPNESIAVASLCALGSRYLVSASVKGVLKIWDAETCHPVEEHTQHEERVADLALSGATLVSASSDRTVKVRFRRRGQGRAWSKLARLPSSCPCRVNRGQSVAVPCSC